MTQNNLNNEINRELEKLDNEFGFSAMDGAMDELRHSLCSIAEKTVEAVRVEEADHAKKGINPGHSKDEMYCCIECELDTEYNAAVTEQSKKAKEWLGEDV